MTYQEIIQAIGNLPLEQQDSLIELIQQQQDEQKHNGNSDRTGRSGDSNANSQTSNDSLSERLRQRSIYHAVERTPEETAEGLRKIESTIEYKRDLWNNMTEEERNISDAQFASVDEYLKQSRG